MDYIEIYEGPAPDSKTFAEIEYGNVTHEEITFKVDKYSTCEMIKGDGRSYNAELGRMVWGKCFLILKPFVPKTKEERKEMERCYALIDYCCASGICPMASILWNYFGLTRDTFYYIIDNPSHRLSGIYNWIFHFLDMVAMENALAGNVNAILKQWIDKSSERKIAAGEQLTAAVRKTELDTMREMGQEVIMRMLHGDDRTESAPKPKAAQRKEIIVPF